MRVAALLLLGVACCGGEGQGERPESRLVIEGDAILEPLSDIDGDADRGRAIFAARERGHCVLCHSVEGLDVPFQGDVGPALSDVGGRFSAEQLRLRIADASVLNARTVMPPYYREAGLRQVGEAYRGKTVLTGRDIEDLIAYLETLKQE